MPSIKHKIATVSTNQKVPERTSAIAPVIPLDDKAGARIMFHKTSLS